MSQKSLVAGRLRFTFIKVGLIILDNVNSHSGIAEKFELKVHLCGSLHLHHGPLYLHGALSLLYGPFTLILGFSLPYGAFPSLSYGDCLEVKREYYQNCSVLGCMTQCSQSAAHI